MNQVDETQPITFNQNTQVNVNLIDGLDRDSKERIADAIQSILNKSQNNIIDVQEETENGNNENEQ